ncbi:MAG: acyl-CoA dehydrogenase family protein [Gordonia sp. (in: high G+C Gram-positive bacteria)]
MDFELSEEQGMLRDTAREVLGRKYDIETLRAVTDTELGWDRGVWSSLAEIGILGLVFSEEDGGMGAGPEELAAVMGVFGSTLAPEPFLGSVVTPGLLVQRAATDDALRAEVLGGLASGERLLAFSHHEKGDRWPMYRVATSASDGTVSGAKSLVDHGDCADAFVVSARDADGVVGLYLVAADAAGVSRTAYRTHDRRRGAQVVFDNAAAIPLGEGDASSIIGDVEVQTQAALCAEAVGAMQRSLTLTTEYLKSRKQFGVTLANFQALAHRAADMYVKLELADSLARYATATLADGRSDAIVSSRAKLQICESGKAIADESIQMHGGIGITAEYPVAHFASRLLAISHTLGDADAHRANLASHVTDWDMVTVG